MTINFRQLFCFGRATECNRTRTERERERDREREIEREWERERAKTLFQFYGLVKLLLLQEEAEEGGIKVENLIVNQTNGFDKQNAFGAADSLSQKKVYQRGNEVWKCQRDYTIKLPSLTRSALGVVLVKRMTKICWAPDSFPIHPRLLRQGRFKPCLRPDYFMLL